ncbi:MAG: hypothetical protein J2P48_17675 [Alphaproteobacteria bacterium]|nr:hypothetical protein [Alphaproteobacteria bacterium]
MSAHSEWLVLAMSHWVALLDVSSERRDTAWRVQQKACDMTFAQEREALLNRRLEATNTALLASPARIGSLGTRPLKNGLRPSLQK